MHKKQNHIYVGLDLHKDTHTAVIIDCWDEKIDSIFNSQLKDKEFRDKCSIIIDNGLNVDNTRQQLEKILKM